MTSALVIAAADAPALETDLKALGVAIAGTSQAANLVRDAAQSGADAIVAWDTYPAAGLLAALDGLQQHAAMPVLLFTSDTSGATLSQALRCGVNAYVVNGYAPQRLRGLLQLAKARFDREAGWRSAHDDLAQRFEERKLVDRAKGILMRSRQIPEDEAFKMLRTAAMQEHLRLGLVSRKVIDAAREAQALNRCGQLRMLSQRIVKLYALQCAGARPGDAPVQQQASSERVAANLEHLAGSLPGDDLSDLLAGVVKAWHGLGADIAGPPRIERLAAVDGGAELLLQAADRLAMALQMSSRLAALGVVNLAGRQRMLSQRLAKQALIGTLLTGEPAQAAAAAAVQTVAEFESALRSLSQTALSSVAIRTDLELAAQQWQALLGGLRDAASDSGRLVIGTASEALLQLFERLTQAYEQGVQQLFEPR